MVSWAASLRTKRLTVRRSAPAGTTPGVVVETKTPPGFTSDTSAAVSSGDVRTRFRTTSTGSVTASATGVVV